MPDNDEDGADLELLRRAVLAGGDIALRLWAGKPRTWQKPGGEGPVTEADLAVDAHLHDTLMAARAGYGWLSEESADDLSRLSRRRVFVIDPIDGTRAYANRERTWAISAAVVEDGHPVAAIVHLPAQRQTYTALRGGGAHRDGRRLAASATAFADAEILAAQPTLDAAHWPGGVPAVRRAFRTSLAYRMALIGEGRFDAMVTFRDTWEWDIAAGALIAAEAGARVTDRDGRALVFNTRGRHAAGVIAGGAAVHAGLIAHRLGDAARSG